MRPAPLPARTPALAAILAIAAGGCIDPPPPNARARARDAAVAPAEPELSGAR